MVFIKRCLHGKRFHIRIPTMVTKNNNFGIIIKRPKKKNILYLYTNMIFQKFCKNHKKIYKSLKQPYKRTNKKNNNYNLLQLANIMNYTKLGFLINSKFLQLHYFFCVLLIFSIQYLFFNFNSRLLSKLFLYRIDHFNKFSSVISLGFFITTIGNSE